jgi:DNA-binding NtrC family response regulator
MFCISSSRTVHPLLVVEPDPLFRLLLCVAMAGEFSDFHAVSTFNEARALIAEHDFAAIIAENDLRGGKGLSLYEEVRRRTPELPFVLICGGIMVRREDPRFRFFAKPFSISDLANELTEMIAAGEYR